MSVSTEFNTAGQAMLVPTKNHLRQMSELGVTDGPTTFLRHVDIRTPRLFSKSIERVLERADKEFEKVASFCGAVVVPHTWRIIEGESPYPQPEGLLPDNHMVVVEVDRIHAERFNDGRPGVPPPDASLMIHNGIKRYARSKLLNPFWQGDLHTEEQFIYGTNTNVPEASSAQTYLVDLDFICHPKYS